jgi:uncharacterized membrane protein YhhN
VDEIEGPLALFAVAVATALAGAEGRRPILFAIAKPLATLALVGVTGTSGSPTVVLILMGLVLSAVGDLALVFEHPVAFLTGLFVFLLAHLGYAAAFLLTGGAGPLWTPLVGVVVFGGASGWMVKRLWGAAGRGMRLPLLIYAAAISAMVASAFSTLAGGWPPAAAASAATGALLFYFSDCNLAWTRYLGSYRRSQIVTLVLYWSGQLGIALAARWVG